MQNHLSDWLRVPLDEITPAMCKQAHKRISTSGHNSANHTLKSFRSIYNFAGKTHELPPCPTGAVEFHKITPPQPIIEDLRAWFDVINGLSNPVHTVFYKLLLTTDLRKEEALTLRWEHIHDNHLQLPMTKNGRPFDLPLVDAHHEILDSVRIFKSDWVFSGVHHGKHLKSPERIAWSPQEHRRTFTPIAANDAVVRDDVVGRLLNHTPATVTGRNYVKTGYLHLAESMLQVVSAFKQQVLIWIQIVFAEYKYLRL